MTRLFDLMDEETTLSLRARKGDTSAQRQLQAVRRKLAEIHDERFGVYEDETGERLRLYKQGGD